MKAIIVFSAALLSASAWAQVYVKPHVTKDGTVVDGYFKTAPNDTKMDNYSTKGNVNPYTGKAGTVDPYKQPEIQTQQPEIQPQRPTNIWGNQSKTKSPF